LLEKCSKNNLSQGVFTGKKNRGISTLLEKCFKNNLSQGVFTGKKNKGISSLFILPLKSDSKNNIREFHVFLNTPKILQ